MQYTAMQVYQFAETILLLCVCTHMYIVTGIYILYTIRHTPNVSAAAVGVCARHISPRQDCLYIYTCRFAAWFGRANENTQLYYIYIRLYKDVWFLCTETGVRVCEYISHHYCCTRDTITIPNFLYNYTQLCTYTIYHT